MFDTPPLEEMVKLQVPIARDVRDGLERRAYDLGFDSAQAYIRFWAKAQADGRRLDLGVSGSVVENADERQQGSVDNTGAVGRGIPAVRFYFNPQLYVSVSQSMDKLQNPNATKLKSDAYYEELMDSIKKAWQVSGDKRLVGIQDALGLEFGKPVLDVTLTPFVRPNNRPLIINSRSEPDRAIDVVTHEMIHELLEDNKGYQLFSSADRSGLEALLRATLGDLPPNTLHHVVVHAVLKYIYLDVLDERSRLERDIKESRGYMFGEHYAQAWDYLEAHNYMSILQRVREAVADAQFLGLRYQG